MVLTLAIGIIIGIFLLGILILIHEAGHFFAAKFFKVKVEEFGFGYPPRIWGKRYGETIYSINAIPAGGFTRLLGEEGVDKDPRSLSAKGPWTRSAVLVAGILTNILFACFLFTIVLAFNDFRFEAPTSVPTSGQALNFSFPFGTQTKQILIGFVDPGSPAERAGLKVLDEVVSANGQSFDSISDFQDFINENKGDEVTLVVREFKSQQARRLTVVPRVSPPKGQGPLGVGLESFYVVEYSSLLDKILVGPEHAANMAYEQVVAISGLVSQSIKEKSTGPVSEAASGPVGIVAILGSFIGRAGASSFWTVLMLVGLIILALGIMNLLPISSAVDGGRLAFALLEAVFHIKVNEGLEKLIYGAGYAFLIVIFVLVTINDIRRIPTYFQGLF